MITARKVQKAFFGAYRFGTNKVFIVAEPIKCLSYRNILAISGRDASAVHSAAAASEQKQQQLEQLSAPLV